MNKQLPTSLVHTITANGTAYLLFFNLDETGYRVTCRNIPDLPVFYMVYEGDSWHLDGELPNKKEIEQLLKTHLHEEL